MLCVSCRRENADVACASRESYDMKKLSARSLSS
jgi:hypothetical protein